MRKSAIKALLDSSGECQSDLSNDCGEHKGSGHDKDADQDHLPALFYEGVDLVADGDSCVSAYMVSGAVKLIFPAEAMTNSRHREIGEAANSPRMET